MGEKRTGGDGAEVVVWVGESVERGNAGAAVIGGATDRRVDGEGVCGCRVHFRGWIFSGAVPCPIAIGKSTKIENAHALLVMRGREGLRGGRGCGGVGDRSDGGAVEEFAAREKSGGFDYPHGCVQLLESLTFAFNTGDYFLLRCLFVFVAILAWKEGDWAGWRRSVSLGDVVVSLKTL